MRVEQLKVAALIPAVVTARDDVVNLYAVSLLEVESTPSALSTLHSEQR
jgi:hypothetical protein